MLRWIAAEIGLRAVSGVQEPSAYEHSRRKADRA